MQNLKMMSTLSNLIFIIADQFALGIDLFYLALHRVEKVDFKIIGFFCGVNQQLQRYDHVM